jgi:hypothetical protein
VFWEAVLQTQYREPAAMAYLQLEETKEAWSPVEANLTEVEPGTSLLGTSGTDKTIREPGSTGLPAVGEDKGIIVPSIGKRA